MKAALIALVVLLCAAPPAVFAHRLDEYLQATTIDIGRTTVVVVLRLTPGSAAFREVFATIDRSGDGIISNAEQADYAERVRSDLSLTVDGVAERLTVVAMTFAGVEELKRGEGEIRLTLTAPVQPGGGRRHLDFQNLHQLAISSYLVNCLVPRDPGITVVAQDRSFNQSAYRLDYACAVAGVADVAAAAGPAAGVPPVGAAPTSGAATGQQGGLSVFGAFLQHGVHHILTGYDHLLFVTALVLAAATFWELVKVVTAFTVAHTITLSLAAFNLVHLPGSVVEPLISASIVVVALQNVIWPDRATGWSRLGIAFFFGLFHGLGFAGGLLDAMHEMQVGTMLLALVAFSIGIELGHQVVVMPLFALLTGARWCWPPAGPRGRLVAAVPRIASAGIALAGFYYLCLALFGSA